MLIQQHVSPPRRVLPPSLKGKIMARGPKVDLTQYPDEYLQCRTLGHHWDFKTDKAIEQSRGRVRSFTTEITCARCSSDKEMGRELRGNRVIPTGTKTAYADGYLFAGNGGRVSRASAWHEVLRRLEEG